MLFSRELVLLLKTDTKKALSAPAFSSTFVTVSTCIQWRMEILLSPPFADGVFLETFLLSFTAVPWLNSSWALAHLILSQCNNLTTSLLSSWVAWPFFQMWQTFLFNLSSRPSSLFIQVSLPHCLIFWHMRTVCSQAFRISFLENVQCSWTPFSLRMVSQPAPNQANVFPPEAQGGSSAAPFLTLTIKTSLI